MSEKNIIFNHKKINNSNFYKNKKLFNIHDIDIDKIIISKKEPYGKKSSIKHYRGYNHDDVFRTLCINLPQIIEFFKHFDSNKTVSLKVNDNRPLKKYTKIWEIVSILMNTEFDSEPVYDDNDKCIKARIKPEEHKVNTNFESKKYQKKMHHTNVCH